MTARWDALSVYEPRDRAEVGEAPGPVAAHTVIAVLALLVAVFLTTYVAGAAWADLRGDWQVIVTDNGPALVAEDRR